jgi:hypothetical protein
MDFINVPRLAVQTMSDNCSNAESIGAAEG